MLSNCLLIGALLFSINNIKSAGTPSDISSSLEVKTSSIIFYGADKKIAFQFINSSDITYALGANKGCKLQVKTDEGTFNSSINNEHLIPGTSFFSFSITAPGNIESALFTNVVEVDTSRNPTSNNALINVDVSTYKSVNGGYIIAGVVAGVVLFIFLVYLFYRFVLKGRIGGFYGSKRIVNQNKNGRVMSINNEAVIKEQAQYDLEDQREVLKEEIKDTDE